MDLYHIALFIHILALVAASAATAVMKLATTHRVRAQTVGEALGWHRVVLAWSKVFPIALAAFVLTGGYMVSRGAGDVWSAGFVVAGLAGVALLFASGIFLGAKASMVKGALEAMVAQYGSGHSAPRSPAPRVVAALPIINTMLALSIVFDMVTKPASVPVALGVVAAGIALGALVALRRPAAEPAAHAPETESVGAAS